MKCDICERQQVEYIGIVCGKNKVCMICINKLVEEGIAEKKRWDKLKKIWRKKWEEEYNPPKKYKGEEE